MLSALTFKLSAEDNLLNRSNNSKWEQKYRADQFENHLQGKSDNFKG